MESKLESCADKAMSSPNVKGICCSDASGLQLCARGSLQSTDTAATLAELVRLGRRLSAANSMATTSAPVIVLESEKTRLLVTSNGAVTVAVHKSH